MNKFGTKTKRSALTRQVGKENTDCITLLRQNTAFVLLMRTDRKQSEAILQPQGGLSGWIIQVL